MSLLRPERRMGEVALRVRAVRVKRKAALGALPLDVAVRADALLDDGPVRNEGLREYLCRMVREDSSCQCCPFPSL